MASLASRNSKKQGMPSANSKPEIESEATDLARRGMAAAAAITALSCRSGGSGPNWRFCTADEARTVEALRRHQRVYRQGIATVDDTSRQRFGRSFADSSPNQQGAVLDDVEKNCKVFFQLILANTQQRRST